MLAALFECQLDQHPLVQSVTAIVLESELTSKMLNSSHSIPFSLLSVPLAEEWHHTELSHNKSYQAFMQKCSQDPQVRKCGMITFLFRPHACI
jgi:hypothetical protein